MFRENHKINKEEMMSNTINKTFQNTRKSGSETAAAVAAAKTTIWCAIVAN